MSANDIIERNAKCARQLLEAGAEIERLTAALKLTRAYIADQPIANVVVAPRGETPTGQHPSLIQTIDAALQDQQTTPLARCEITGNHVGTDTWMVGHECQCGPCQRMLREGAAPR